MVDFFGNSTSPEKRGGAMLHSIPGVPGHPLGVAAEWFAVAAILAIFATYPSPLQSQEPPTIGETIGEHIGQAFSDIRDGRHLVATFNADLAEARERFWALYPDGDGFPEAEAWLAELLMQKDIHFLHQSMIVQSVPGSDSFLRLTTGLLGQIDEGILAQAGPEFGRWAIAVRERAGPYPLFPNYLGALEESGPLYLEYVRMRNRAEFYIGPRSPLRSEDPEEYLVAMIMMGTTTGTNLPMTQAEAQALFEELMDIIGEEALLNAGRSMIVLRKAPDPYFILQEVSADLFGPSHRNARPEPYLDRTLTADNVRDPGVFYSYTPAASPARWPSGWQEARMRHERLVAQHGEEHVNRAASLVARVVQRFDVPDRRWILAEPEVLGSPHQGANETFRHLVALSPAELVRLEESFTGLMDVRGRRLARMEAIHTPPVSVPGRAQPLVIRPSRFFGAMDGFLYGFDSAHRMLRMRADGSDFEIIHELDRGVWSLGMDHPIDARISPDGALYGSIQRGNVSTDAYNGALFRLGLDGTDMQVLRRFEREEGSTPRLVHIDADGLLFGVAHMPRGAGAPSRTAQRAAIWRFDPAAGEHAILHERWVDIGMATWDGFGPFVEGDDGYLYGSVLQFGVSEAPPAPAAAPPMARDGQVPTRPAAPTTEYRVQAFRLRKDGTGYEMLREFPGSGSRMHNQVELALGVDGALYGMTGRRQLPDGEDPGHLFRMNRDGTGYTVLHELLGAGGQLVAGADGMLYGLARADRSMESFFTATGYRPFQLDPRGGGPPTFFDLDLEEMPSGWRFQNLILYGGELFAVEGMGQRGASVYRVPVDGHRR